MVANEQEGQKTRDALEGISPVSRGAVFRDVVSSFERELDAVPCVKKQWEKNPSFEQVQVGHVVDVAHGGIEGLLASESSGVRPQVKHHEATNRRDAGQ